MNATRAPFAAAVLIGLVAGCAGERGAAGPAGIGSLSETVAVERLWEKAVWHERTIGDRHLTAEGLLAYQADATRPEGAGVRPTAYSDMAIWSGLYLAAEALRWAVTADPDARRRVERVVGGLSFLQDITRTPGLLARAVQPVSDPPDPLPDWRPGEGDDRNYRWLGNVSVDQVLGVVYGYGLAFDLDVESSTQRRAIARRVADIADHIAAHGMTIVDSTGRRVKHGDLSPGWASENLNALIALAVFKTAAHMSPEGPYQRIYRDLIDRHGYARRARAARDRWWESLTGVNHSDNNLAMLAYDVLLRYEEDASLREQYRSGLDRTWRVVRSEGNALFTYIARSGGVAVGGDSLRSALRSLLEFPLDQRDDKVINSTREDVCLSARRDRAGDLQACAPLSVSERPRGPFEWNENPYRLDRLGGGTQAYSGLGYLLAYWMGRQRDLIEAPCGKRQGVLEGQGRTICIRSLTPQQATGNALAMPFPPAAAQPAP